ncbi:hypothetical protein [Dactylosporangium sp. CA-139066]
MAYHAARPDLAFLGDPRRTGVGAVNESLNAVDDALAAFDI